MYYNNSEKPMSLLEYGDKFIINDIARVVEVDAYLAFFILSAAIEFIARCWKHLPDFHKRNGTSNIYIEAIDNIQALAKYRMFDYQVRTRNGYKNANKLYSAIRCGLLHAGIPNRGITLHDNNNNLAEKIVGCKDLYEDIKFAWAEIKTDNTILTYLQNTKAIVISTTPPTNKNTKGNSTSSKSA